MRIVDYLLLNAEKYPSKSAIICGGDRMSYAQLSAAIRRSAQQGEECRVFRATQDADFIVHYFALHLADEVAVPLGKDVHDDFIDEISDLVSAQDIPVGTADILFTTGTTGASKGVMISHRAMVADAENLIEAQGFRSDTTFVICGPLNHIGSLSKIWPIFVVGGTLVITEGMKDLNAFYDALEVAGSCIATFLVPASIRMLLKFSRGRLSEFADKIDFIETGAAAISQDDMEALCSVLPHTRLFNTYASTETGIIATFNYNEGECLAGCLGRPMRHSSVEISSEGLIVCRGDTIMTGYVGETALTNEILFDGAIHTQDIGEIDAQGRLCLRGRVGDVINIGVDKVSPTEVEDVALRCPGVRDCVLISVEHPVVGTALKLLVVPDRGDLKKKDVALFLKERLELHKVPQLYDFVDHVERTFNGKINRKFYQQ